MHTEKVRMQITIVGIDCATKAKKMGLALASFSRGRTAVIAPPELGSNDPSSADVVAGWIREHAGRPTLLALDAPLGWPASLAPAIAHHHAGAEIPHESNLLFRRETDRFVKREVKQQSLDVGADRIARTAHATLSLLAELRRRLNQPIPLAWDPKISGLTAIEVYPAATLKAHGITYEVDSETTREQLRDELGNRIAMPSDTNLMRRSRDALDAVVCVLAAHDFLMGQALRPYDEELAKKEGWIWVRDPAVPRGPEANCLEAETADRKRARDPWENVA